MIIMKIKNSYLIESDLIGEQNARYRLLDARTIGRTLSSNCNQIDYGLALVEYSTVVIVAHAEFSKQMFNSYRPTSDTILRTLVFGFPAAVCKCLHLIFNTL